MSSQRTAHLLFGLPGCGKSTFGKEVARRGGTVHFSHDEWMAKLYGQNPAAEHFPEYFSRIHDLIWQHVDRVLAAGADVILDFGFWTRKSRDEARDRVRRSGAEPKLYSFDCDTAEAKRRVLVRNQTLPADCLLIDEYAFDLFASKLEPLGIDEDHIFLPSDQR